MFEMANAVRDIEQADAPRAGPPALHSAFRILEALARRSGQGATLTDLTQDLGLSKSSAHGLLAALEVHGMVQRDEQSRRYWLGASLVRLGRAAASQSRTAVLASERTAALASEHQLTFAVAQITAFGDAQVVDRVYPAVDVHVGIALGSRYGPFDGAIGKCLLAAMDEPEAERVIRTAVIPGHTSRTLTKPEQLLREIATVRKRGWAASVGELKENHAVATVVRGASGELEMVIVAVGFPAQLPKGAMPFLGGSLREAARAIEHAAGMHNE
jgi:IclR family acetate operon transcriptional repressor